MTRPAAILAMILPLAVAADVTGAGPELRGPYHVRADGSIVVGRSVIPATGADRAAALVGRSLELATRFPSAGPIHLVIDPSAPPESARRLLAAFRRAAILHEDSAAIEGATLRITSKNFVAEIRMGADADSVTRAAVGMALEELKPRQLAANAHYRALTEEGKQEEARAFLPHYLKLSRVYSQLYQLQRQAQR